MADKEKQEHSPSKEQTRVLCWFSCGAASAVAAKIAAETYHSRCQILYCDTSSDEHEDNRRFLKDVEDWIGQPIIRLKSQQYKDRWEVYRKTGFLVSHQGARCTVELKKRLRFAYQQPDDLHILGYTIEEGQRVKRFKVNNPELLSRFILIEKGLSKKDCLGLLWRSGIKLPEMYESGYDHNNCIGCVRGGKGYWNKVRKDFPAVYEKMAKLEREMNARIFPDCFLDELSESGRYPFRSPVGCSVFCEMAYQDINTSQALPGKEALSN